MSKATRIIGIVLTLVLLAACEAPAPQVVKETVVVAGTPQVVERVVTTTPPTSEPTAAPKRPNLIRAHFEVSTDVPTLDPSVAQDNSSVTTVEQTFVGLVRLDEVTNEPRPGLAAKWDISPDGKVYTFTLRSDVPWVKYDGIKKQVVKVQTCPDKDKQTRDRLVVAKDFEYGILRALRPATASPYGYLLGAIIENADLFNSGAITDPNRVGIKALDDTRLEIRFKEPGIHNFALLGWWTATAVPKWVIEGDGCTEKRGERWTEPGFIQSYGPFTLKEWLHGSTLTVVRNPFWQGDEWTPQPRVDEVTWLMLDATSALAAFSEGNLDAANVSAANLERVKADAQLSPLLATAPNLCTYYYGFNTRAKVVDDVRVRRALSLAIDRQALVENVTKGAQEPAQWFVLPGVMGSPNTKAYPDLGIKFNPTEARKLLDEYVQDKKTTVDRLDVALTINTSPGSQKIAEAIVQMWKANLGLNVKLTQQDWDAFLRTVKSRNTPQLWRGNWCLDYPDANNFLRDVVGVGGSYNPADRGTPYGGLNWKNDKYEELVKKAVMEPDAAKRVEMYAQAEQILVYDVAAMIPLYWYTRSVVTQPWIKRTISFGGRERYERWEVVQ